jgi:hypothetical protein
VKPEQSAGTIKPIVFQMNDAGVPVEAMTIETDASLTFGPQVSDIGTAAASDLVLVLDVSDGSKLRAVQSSTIAGGSVTSVAVSGTDGLEVDSGSPITGSGTIVLGVNASALRTHLNVYTITEIDAELDLKAPLSSPGLTGTPTAPTAAGGTNTTQIATTAFVLNELSGVTGGLGVPGDLNCSTNPNYPSATAGDNYYVTVAGKIGGASGVDVEVGDLIVAKSNNAGGTQAAVGSSWFVLEKNLTGALLTANNLSEVDAATARTNLGVDAAGTDNSTPVTLAGTPDYITISGQEITRNQINLSTDVTGAFAVPSEIYHVNTSQTPSLGNVTIDWTTSTFQTLDLSSLSGALTVSFTDPSGPSRLSIKLVQGATARDITWPAAVKWDDGDGEPTWSGDANKTRIISLLYG